MKKFTKLTGMLFVAAIMTFAFSSESQATSGFARQTGYACATCHFNTFPQLNAFGRTFKAGGYTMMGTQGKIEDDHLSIPDTLNIAFVSKLRYSMTNGDTKAGRDRGQFETPDEAALLIGGRAGEHIGFLLEQGLMTGAGFDHYKVVFPYDLGGTTVAGGIFTSGGNGAAQGFEPLNTGALGLQRGFGEGVAIPAFQYLGLNGTEATGIVLYVANDKYFVNATLWGPTHTGYETPSGLNLGQYLRAAVTPNIGGWDLALGGSLFMGESKIGEAAADTHVVNGTVVDAQALGQVADMPLAVYLTYGVVPKAGTDGKTYTVASATGDKSAASIAAQLGVIPSTLFLNLGYRMGDNGNTTNSKENALDVGATYKLAQNLKVQFDHAIFSGDDAKQENGTYDARTTLMLFGSF